MIQEWFDDFNDKAVGSSTSTVKVMCRQERDWTCSIGCLRTLLSASMDIVPSEEELIKNYDVNIGPQNSKDIHDWGLKELENTDVLYGFKNPIGERCLEDLTRLLQTYNVMVECMLYNAHWLVVLGYIQLGSPDDDKIILYDPYYNDVRILHGAEFIDMWFDTAVEPLHRDYVAIKKRGL